MSVLSHPITVTVYSPLSKLQNYSDTAVVQAGATVLIRNCTKKTTLVAPYTGTTNASGIAIVDLANLPIASGQSAEYTTGDEVLIIAHLKEQYSVCAKYIVTGNSKTQTLYLKEVPYKGGAPGTEVILDVLATNQNASTAYFFKAYSFDDGEMKLFAYVPSKVSLAYNANRGVSGKIVVEVENKDICVMMNFK